MDTQERVTPHPLLPVVSDEDSDDDFIGAPPLESGKTLGNYGPTSIHIPTEPPPQKPSEEASYGLNLKEVP